MKTAEQIIAEVNDVARIMLRYIGTGYEAPPDHRFWADSSSRGGKAWSGAVEVYERITCTEVHDALLKVREAASPEPLHYVTQRNQPYGSARRCCEMCGRMCWHGMKGSATRWTDEWDVWQASPQNCSTSHRQGTAGPK